MAITILLVDDHDLIRQGLAHACERDARMTVVGQAADVASALAAWRTLRPDVVVTDLQLPDGTGLDLIRAIREESADTGLVMLTMHTGDAQILAALEAGASAFLGKESRGAEVVSAVAHAAKAPRSFLCSGLAGAVMRRATVAAGRLTPREQQVLSLLAEGLGSAEIGARLYLGESTVKTHIGRIYHKLGVTNRAQALVAAMRLGLLFEQLSTAG
ncbi:response regulator transcription factor [Nocardioides sp. LS1]|uniref:response regulator transcription factor n=1 Tax=Nocardioides sp. LS1 TaxID=1027620 RepID=UPI000F625767|nr:response regulator transcription factor [Nocardioides sp. LS1]GCD88938.1 putative nitrate/nitrite response transcriptional regulatory protein NarL (LuxR family) [Nocardioides sp. LS1]